MRICQWNGRGTLVQLINQPVYGKDLDTYGDIAMEMKIFYAWYNKIPWGKSTNTAVWLDYPKVIDNPPDKRSITNE